MSNEIIENQINEAFKDISLIHDISLLAEQLEDFDKFDKLKINALGTKLRIDRYSFKNSKIANQYISAINDFGKILKEISNSHFQQIKNIQR